MATMQFIRLLLNGQKKMVKTNQVKFVTVKERYSELKVETLMAHCVQHLPVVLEYLPADYETPGKVCREYLLNLMNTLHEGMIEELRIEALTRAKNRHNNRVETIELKDEFRDLLHNPLFPLSKQAVSRRKRKTAVVTVSKRRTRRRRH